MVENRSEFESILMKDIVPSRTPNGTQNWYANHSFGFWDKKKGHGNSSDPNSIGNLWSILNQSLDKQESGTSLGQLARRLKVI